MTVEELIKELSKLPKDLPVCCAANGYDSEACPPVQVVRGEVAILLDGDYYPVRSFPPQNIENDTKYQVVVIG